MNQGLLGFPIGLTPNPVLLGWPLGKHVLSPVSESVGANTATSKGTLVTAAGTAHVKGAYAELTASSPIDADAITVVPANPSVAGLHMLDVAVGLAGNEIDVLSNIPFDVSASRETCALTLPIPIRAGERIACRIQSGTASATMWLAVILHRDGYFKHLGMREATTYGADTATTSGVAIPYAGDHVKSAWTELSPSTATTRLALIRWGLRNAGVTATISALLDVGYGPAGSETTLISNIMSETNTVGDRYYPDSLLLPLPLTAGSRLVARAQYSGNFPRDIVVIGFD